MNKKRSTIREISLATGYSPSTLSRFVNHPELLKENTRKDVMEKILGCGLSMPQPMLTKKHIIGLTFSDPSSLFTSAIISAIEKMLANSQYQLLLINMAERIDAYKYFNHHSGILKKIDGLIISGGMLSMEGSAFFKKIGIPLSLIHTSCPNEFSVLTNNYAGGQGAAKHLLSQGYKRVGMVRWSPSDEHIHDRYLGFSSVFEEAECSIHPDYLIDAPLSSEGGFGATKRLMELACPPEAIFYGCDAMAAGGCRYLREQGIRVSEDVGVIGFDNLFIAQLMGITTMDQYIDKKIEMVVNNLFARLGELSKAVSSKEEVSITPKVVIRTSLRYNSENC